MKEMLKKIGIIVCLIFPLLCLAVYAFPPRTVSMGMLQKSPVVSEMEIVQTDTNTTQVQVSKNTPKKNKVKKPISVVSPMFIAK